MKQMVYSSVLKNVVYIDDKTSGTFPTYVDGYSLTINGKKVQAKASSANVVQANIKCGAGLAQVVDNVLMMVDLGGR